MSEITGASETEGSGLTDWIDVARAAGEQSNPFGAHEEEVAESEYLLARSEGVAYGIPVARVREIIRMRQVASVPRSPDWLVGVVSLRGDMVEVLSLRKRLGGLSAEATRRSRIIVLRGPGEEIAGLLVDRVDQVHRIAETDLLPPPDADSEFVSKMYASEGEFVSVLDLDRVLEVNDE